MAHILVVFELVVQFLELGHLLLEFLLGDVELLR